MIKLNTTTNLKSSGVAPVWILFVSLVISIMAGCGGGGGGSQLSNTTQQSELSIYTGTVAIGAPIVGATVKAQCQGASAVSGATDVGGKFSISIRGSAPCSFEVKTATGLTMQSMALAPGVVNVTPITDLGVKLAQNDFQKLNLAKATIIGSLPNWGIDLVGDPFTTTFNADGTGHDKAILQYVAMANATSPVFQTSTVTNSPITVVNSRISNECAGTIGGSCYPIEAEINLIQDEQIKELVAAFLEKLNVDVTFGVFGVLSSAGSIDGIAEAAIKKGVQYLAATYFRYAAPHLKKGLLKCFASNPQCARSIGYKLAEEFKKESTKSIFSTAKDVASNGKVQFILELASDFMLDKLELELINWKEDSDSLALGIGKSVNIGLKMYSSRVAMKVAITMMAHPKTVGLAMLGNPILMRSLVLISETEILIDYMLKDVALIGQIWYTQIQIAESEAHARALDLVMEDYEDVNKTSRTMFITWLRSGMVGSADVDLYLNTRRMQIDWLWQVDKYNVDRQSKKYDELITLYGVLPSLCRARGVAECLTAMGVNDPFMIQNLTAVQSARGLAVNGSFALSGSTVNSIRVNAGTSALASDTYCSVDLPATFGDKNFSFSGSWGGKNGRTCSTLLPSAGASASIVFTIEARDASNNFSNNGVLQSVTALYRASATAAVIPAVPVLSLVGKTSNSVSLQWTNPVGATYYVLNRSGIDSNRPNSSSFVDSGVTPSTVYTYTIKACNITGCSAASSTLSVTTDAAAPVIPAVPVLSLVGKTSNSVSLQWTNPVGATYYVLNRSGIDSNRPNSSSFVDNGVTPRTAYTYTIKACNIMGCSAASSVLSVTTPP